MKYVFINEAKDYEFLSSTYPQTDIENDTFKLSKCNRLACL